jgi:hypothetical protein
LSQRGNVFRIEKQHNAGEHSQGDPKNDHYTVRFNFDKTIINHPETKLFQICRSHKKPLSAYVETTDFATLRLNYGNREKVIEKFQNRALNPCIEFFF